MQVGIDFGTSNTSIARPSQGGAELIGIEGTATSIPTAIFYETANARFTIGQQAVATYDSGEDGRLMRSIKSVLGTSLIEEKTDIGDRRIPFQQVIADFLRSIIENAGQQIGQPINAVVQGRPVSFNDTDAERDARAQNILEFCLKNNGIKHVEFLDEPVAAARSVDFPSGREKRIFVIDIGGGTSDFSVVRLSSDNSKFDVLGSAGVYVGGNDFDRLLSFHELTLLFGRDETLSRNKLPAPTAPYSTLSDWKSLNRLYTREYQKKIAWMRQNSPNSRGIEALDHLVQNFAAHAYARSVEAIKIDLSDKVQQEFAYQTPHFTLEKTVLRSAFEDIINDTLSRMDAVAAECLKRSGIAPDQITDIVMVGGSTCIPRVAQHLSRHFTNAAVSDNDRFGAVAKGLARHAAANA